MAYRQDPPVDVVAGALFGAGAFIVGWLLTFMGSLVGTVSAAANTPTPSAAANVPASSPATPGPTPSTPGDGSGDSVAEGSTALADPGGLSGTLLSHVRVHDMGRLTGSSFEPLLLPHTLVVVALLVVAGYVVASSAGHQWMSGGFKHGASIATGYFALTLLSMLVLVVQVEGVDLVAVKTALALVLTGVVYPVVFGGLGGLIAKSR